MHALTASSRIRKAQLWAGALLAAAVVVTLVPLAGINRDMNLSGLPSTADKKPPAEQPGEQSAMVIAMLDSTDIGAALNTAAPFVPKTVKIPDEPPKVVDNTPPPPPPPPPWRFVGSILNQAGNVGFVVINTVTKMVKVGDTFESVNVLEINSEAMRVAENGIEKVIPLSPRQNRTLLTTEISDGQPTAFGRANPASLAGGLAVPNDPVALRAAQAHAAEMAARQQEEGDARMATYREMTEHLAKLAASDPGAIARLNDLSKQLDSNAIEPDGALKSVGSLLGDTRIVEYLLDRHSRGDISREDLYNQLGTIVRDQAGRLNGNPGDPIVEKFLR